MLRITMAGSPSEVGRIDTSDGDQGPEYPNYAPLQTGIRKPAIVIRSID
jgi:hypothetical protein